MATRFFIALEDFKDDELRSEYCRGLSYSVRDGNEVLAKKAEAWAQRGLIRWAAGGSSVQGKG